MTKTELEQRLAAIQARLEHGSRLKYGAGPQASRRRARDFYRHLERISAEVGNSALRRHAKRVLHQLGHHGARYRRASHGGKTVRCGSRRVSAGSRAGPDDEGELPGSIVAPLSVGGRR